MKHRLKRLVWTIEDHIKDSGYDLKNARIEKEDEKEEMANFYLTSAKQRLEMANTCVSKMDTLLNEYEREERAKGKSQEIVDEKIEAWECLRNILENKIKCLSREVQEMKM